MKQYDVERHLLVMEVDGVSEEHGADVAGIGSGHGDDLRHGQFVEDPRLIQQPRRMRRRRRRQRRRLRLHLHVAVAWIFTQRIRRHPRSSGDGSGDSSSPGRRDKQGLSPTKCVIVSDLASSFLRLLIKSFTN